ncbi:MAG: ABC transporter permease [Gammaproteobacteria bacterium]|nr:ABC transporter permease [Gammaproteobacteria bacterium]
MPASDSDKPNTPDGSSGAEPFSGGRDVTAELTSSGAQARLLHLSRPLEALGRGFYGGLARAGHAAALLVECLYWVLFGRAERQPVRVNAVVAEMMEIGVRAVPIVSVLSATIGVMLAIQGIHTLRIFGAESMVTIGISLSVLREFAPLITAILVTGRSGSALAARLGTMTINQEIDALRVMGINPVRFLVSPSLIALLVMVPALTLWADALGLLAAGLYVSMELDISLTAYANHVLEVTRTADLAHGLGKSFIFATLIGLIAVINGAAVAGGAEGVGKATTHTVVQSIAAIVITDMLFVFIVTR